MRHTRDDAIPNSPAATLEARWQRFGIHRASRAARLETWTTGWPWLDALLPGGGYPLAAVTEFLVEHPGQGELSLLLAALAPRLKAGPASRLAWIDPPYRLNAPALDSAGLDRARVPVIRCRTTAERIWSIEQLAAVAGFTAFVLWDDNLDTPALRRLQLASEKAGCPVFVYRNLACARQRSPAALRIAISGRENRQQLEILKCRGPAGARATGLTIGPLGTWQAPQAGDRAHQRQAENDDDGLLDHREDPQRTRRSAARHSSVPDSGHPIRRSSQY